MSGLSRKGRRAPGEGTFEKLPSGKVRCYVRENGKKISGEAAPTRRQAATNLKVALKSVKGDPSEQLFTTFARNWHNSRTKNSPATIETEGYWLDALDKDPLFWKPVKAITAKDLDKWKKRQTIGTHALRNRCCWLNQILKAADVDARVEVPSKGDHARRPLAPAERAALAKIMASAPKDVQLAQELCRTCGLRISEACGLKHEDAQDGGIWVRRVVLITKGKMTVRAKGKSVKSFGWVPLPPRLKGIVGEGNGYVLGDGETPMNPKALRDTFALLVKGTILENVPYMGFHALRRTYGMSLLESGAEVVTAAKNMRHDPKMLLNEYARSRTDLMVDAVNKAFG